MKILLKSLFIFTLITLSTIDVNAQIGHGSGCNGTPQTVHFVQRQLTCNTEANPCVKINIRAIIDFHPLAPYCYSVRWSFGNFVCSVIGENTTNPIVEFDTQAIFDSTGQSGTQFVPIQISVTKNGVTKTFTYNVRILVC